MSKRFPIPEFDRAQYKNRGWSAPALLGPDDQIRLKDAARRGVFAPFRGRPASPISTPADLALRAGAVMLTAFAARTGPGFRHHVRFDPPVDTSSSGDRDADVTRIMTDVNQRLEAALRRAPEQWLWMHRRWKTVQKHGESRPE